MSKIELYTDCLRIPNIGPDFEINLKGDLFYKNIKIDLDTFNDLTSLNVKDILVLKVIVFRKFKWPPVYWKHLRVLKLVDDNESPESLLLSIDYPVESLEYPGFYLIPYFSNYVINKEGILIKKSEGIEIIASEGNLGYYTYRMKCDDGQTSNRLRHRILCMAFKKYKKDIEELDINHIDGIPGNDNLDNLEWCSRSENITHAYALNLRSDNKPVQIKNIYTGITYIFPSCSAAARELKVTETTISNRAKTNGYKAFDGYQFRFHPNELTWPDFERLEGKFIVEFPNGEKISCGAKEAAFHAGVTRTSLLRLLREGRQFGLTKNKITRM